MDIPVLLLDMSFHCIKTWQSGKWKCMCDFRPQPVIQQERRLATFLAIFGAVVTGFDLTVTTVSLMGARVGETLLTKDQKSPIPELSKILKSGVVFKVFLHTSLLFRLGNHGLSNVHRSRVLLSLIQHAAPIFHVADAKWSVEDCFSRYVNQESTKTRKFVDKVWDETEMTPVCLTPAEGDQTCTWHMTLVCKPMQIRRLMHTLPYSTSEAQLL